MEILNTILYIVLIFVSIVLVVFILLQNNRSSGASLFGGSSQSAFGASSADALTKITAVLVVVFVAIAFILTFIRSRTTNIDDLKKELGSSSQQELVEPQMKDSLQTKPVEPNEPSQE